MNHFVSHLDGIVQSPKETGLLSQGWSQLVEDTRIRSPHRHQPNQASPKRSLSSTLSRPSFLPGLRSFDSSKPLSKMAQFSCSLVENSRKLVFIQPGPRILSRRI